ncbi:DUF4038 domain-containing protein [Pedosphaera parvula]|nr:DUF4038 domain-containing protein [Pedosphaera parvula]
MKRTSWRLWRFLSIICFFLSNTCFCQAKVIPWPVIAKWGVFEKEFRSSVTYANPLQDITLSVEFTSPQGEKIKTYGFWDGARIWKFRFSPDQAGKWTYQTSCSDAANTNLNKVIGEFLCVKTTRKSRFDLHGPIQLSHDQVCLEHQDHTPFLWLADIAWSGALLSKSTEWETYAGQRAKQSFTAVQWVAAPGRNSRNQSVFESTSTTLTINLNLFQQLDSRIETLNRAGLLSAILPLRDLEAQAPGLETIPEEQAVQLLRYMVARWGAYNVAWIIMCEGDNLSTQVARWKRVGRSVFANQHHAPVILHPGTTYWVLDEFRAEPWVDVLSYQSGQEADDNALQWLLAGPLAIDWQRVPLKPFINLAPYYENSSAPASVTQTSMVRRLIYWSLLNAPTAGVSYGADGVWNWQKEAANKRPNSNAGSPVWQKNLTMPVAEQMKIVGQIFNSIEFWRLRPAPGMLVVQPGDEHPARHISATQSSLKDLSVIYIPEERSVDLKATTIPTPLKATWINARTGDRMDAVGYVAGPICRFITPQPGDWLLLIQPDPLPSAH